MRNIAIVFVVVAALLVSGTYGLCSRLFPGYGGIRWGTTFHSVSRTFRNGTPGRIGEQVIYKQLDPDKIISQRTFGFKNDGLTAVSITFSPAYVRRTGVDTILSRFVAMYGEPTTDASAPHLVSSYWEDATTRITFAYTSQSPDMTVLLFQQKNN